MAPLFAVWSFIPGLLNFLLIMLSLFMILLVLIQRGKGGGLIGALGGAGGSSAFGSRAGDTFTRITIVVATIWLFLILALIKIVQPGPTTTQQPGIERPLPGLPEDGGS
jgi:preprotein translocase subunit SecG